MDDLNQRAFEGLVFLVVALAALLFLPAWTLQYWQAWLFLGVFAGSILAITLYLMKYDRALLERRTSAGPAAEKERSQQIIQSIAAAAFVSVFILSALDHRFGWSVIATPLVILGDILVALGLLAIFFVFRANTFTSGTVGIARDQKVISTGPYAIVRHPMYAAAVIMFAGIPLALDSVWGLLTAIPLTLSMVWRLLEEEKFLKEKLPGYVEYTRTVRSRLIPYIW